MAEKRKAQRMPVDYEFFMNYLDNRFTGKCRDISLHGIGIYIDESLSQGETAELSLVIKDLNITFHLEGVVAYCIENPQKSDDPHQYLAGVEFTDGHKKGLPFLADNQVSHHAPSCTISINADAKKCYELLAEYERYPEWTTGIKGIRVTERFPDGRGKLVEFEHNFFMRKIRYVNDYTYDDENNTLRWATVGGDKELVSSVGSYSFLQRGEGQTSATFKTDITVAIVPSKRIVDYFTTVLIRKEMKNFKRFVEKQKD